MSPVDGGVSLEVGISAALNEENETDQTNHPLATKMNRVVFKNSGGVFATVTLSCVLFIDPNEKKKLTAKEKSVPIWHSFTVELMELHFDYSSVLQCGHRNLVGSAVGREPIIFQSPQPNSITFCLKSVDDGRGRSMIYKLVNGVPAHNHYIN